MYYIINKGTGIVYTTDVYGKIRNIQTGNETTVKLSDDGGGRYSGIDIDIKQDANNNCLNVSIQNEQDIISDTIDCQNIYNDFQVIRNISLGDYNCSVNNVHAKLIQL